MSTRFSHLRLLIPEDQFEGCKVFYRDVLGLEISLETEENIYAEFKTEGVLLSLYQRELMASVISEGELPDTSNVGASIALVFQVENVDQRVDELKSKGVKFITEAHDQAAWHQRVAHFRDPAGNLLEIFQSLAPVE